MKTVNSILVVVDRTPSAADAVSKAVLLARKFGARVKLFMCDAESGYALSQAYVQKGVEEARKASIAGANLYLDTLRQAACADDVAIAIEAGCESPLYESIVRKVAREQPDLVIKSAAGLHGKHPMLFDSTDWQLMRTCPATLMLTRGRAWRAHPRFAAAVDASMKESAGLAGDILQSAHTLAGCAGGELDVIYAEAMDISDDDRERGTRALHELVGKLPDAHRGIHVLAGNPEVSLPGFAKRREYDAMLLGALTHHPGFTAQVGTLTSKLVEALECDFILVKPGTYRTPVQDSHVRAQTPSWRHA
jgi:universal stress protein E